MTNQIYNDIETAQIWVRYAEKITHVDSLRAAASRLAEEVKRLHSEARDEAANYLVELAHLRTAKTELLAKVAGLRAVLQKIATQRPINDEPLAKLKCKQAAEALAMKGLWK